MNRVLLSQIGRVLLNFYLNVPLRKNHIIFLMMCMLEISLYLLCTYYEHELLIFETDLSLYDYFIGISFYFTFNYD